MSIRKPIVKGSRMREPREVGLEGVVPFNLILRILHNEDDLCEPCEPSTVHTDYPHEPGLLYDCAACENNECRCTPTSAPCVSRECMHGSFGGSWERVERGGPT